MSIGAQKYFIAWRRMKIHNLSCSLSSESNDANNFLSELLRGVEKMKMNQQMDRKLGRRPKVKTKSITLRIRVYPDLFAMLQEAGLKEEKNPSEYVLKLICKELNLNYMQYKS
jgi:hypothetical protein